MGLRMRLAEERQAFDAVAAVAACRDSLMFADLCWPPFDVDAELQRAMEGRDLGVILETARRVVVIEEHGGELRYYAGGWRSDQSRICAEQDRIQGEGYELGVLPSPGAAIRFSERFLVQLEPLQEIDIPRLVRYRQDTERSRHT